MRTHRILVHSLVLSAAAALSTTAQSQGTPVPVKPGIRVTDVGDLKIADELKGSIAPPALSATQLAARLAAMGLTSATISDDKPLRLTVVAPRQPEGNLELAGAATNTGTPSGSASVGIGRSGSVTVKFNTEPGARYVVDFSVGHVPCYGCPPGETKRFIARIWSNYASGSDDGARETARQEFTFPRGPQHVVLVAPANTRRLMVNLASWAGTGPPTDSAPQVDNFVFYSVQISKLR